MAIIPTRKVGGISYKHQNTRFEQKGNRALAALLMANCQTTGDIQAKLKRLFTGTIEQMLETEMDEHLGTRKTQLLETIRATAAMAMVKIP